MSHRQAPKKRIFRKTQWGPNPSARSDGPCAHLEEGRNYGERAIWGQCEMRKETVFLEEDNPPSRTAYRVEKGDRHLPPLLRKNALGKAARHGFQASAPTSNCLTDDRGLISLELPRVSVDLRSFAGSFSAATFDRRRPMLPGACLPFSATLARRFAASFEQRYLGLVGPLRLQSGITHGRQAEK